MRIAVLWIFLVATDVIGQSYVERVKSTLAKETIAIANELLKVEPVSITAYPAERSAGGHHDFYSEGDYWWPDSSNLDGPFIQRDGQTNPDNFTAHRKAMIAMSAAVANLTSAWLLTKDNSYLGHAVHHLRVWFVDDATKMNPSLLYAQAIKGRVTGRGIGIIDTIHLIEVAQSVFVLKDHNTSHNDILDEVSSWFSKYLGWLTTHPFGLDEMNAKNNHGTCWVMQVAAFAKLTGDTTLLNFCSERYQKVLLPAQMEVDGSFPLELKRTKPYGYSIFNLDAMVMICQILSDERRDLWNFETTDGRSIKKGLVFLYPFLADKFSWPFAKDIMYWNEWPVAQPSLLFGSIQFDQSEWLALWTRLDHFPENEEVIRNLPVRHPLIWLSNSTDLSKLSDK